MPNLLSVVPPSRCPHCGFPIDPIAWQEKGHRPDIGDLTICQGCARVLRFGRRLKLNAMTDRDERAFLAANPDIKHQCAVVARQLLTHLTLRELPPT